ncbi:MAG: AI-2E family transporter [Candidatus Nanohaloarchaea archaeon]|nr:AI-2E family transporter [Candidatus Nanohaloarchaea archaeon]
MDLTSNLKKNLQFYFLIALLIVFGGISLMIIWRYIGYILVAAFLAFLTYPIFSKVNNKVENEDLASLLVIIAIVVIIVLPLLGVSGMLVNEASAFVRQTTIDSGQLFERVEGGWKAIVQGNAEIKNAIARSLTGLSGALQRNLANLVGAVADFFIGIFMMLFLMYYLYKQGPAAVSVLKEVMPMEKEYKDRLFSEVDGAVKGVFLGHLFTAFVQGIVGATGFLLFGISRPILWGFVILLLAVIPFLGPFVIYIPVSLAFFFSGDPILGILLLVYGVGFVGLVDNFVRPYMTSMYTEIHPAVVLVSVIGGMASMGAIGILLGPLFFAIFVALIRTYQDTVSDMIG